MRFTFLLILMSAIFLLSCENQEEECYEEDLFFEEIEDELSVTEQEVIEKIDTSELEHYLIEMGLVNIQEISPEIMVDLKYASTDNFLGINLYGQIQNAYLQPDVAERLGKVQDYLNENHPNLRLYVFDAVRPTFVQQKMWDALDSLPINERVKYVSNPKNHSIHNYGAAVDLSLFDMETDTLLDMGAGFDDFHPRAYPKKEQEMLKSGVITELHIENRELLRTAMREGGFWVLPTEWWHFNAVNRDTAKKRYEVVDF